MSRDLYAINRATFVPGGSVLILFIQPALALLLPVTADPSVLSRGIPVS
jgi:hypothetical protein